MKPFDLEAVFKGAEFETHLGNECRCGGASPDGEKLSFWVKFGDEWVSETFSIKTDLNNYFKMKPIKRTKKVWINVYPEKQIGVVYDSQEEADQGAFEDRVACIPVTLEWTE